MKFSGNDHGDNAPPATMARKKPPRIPTINLISSSSSAASQTLLLLLPWLGTAAVAATASSSLTSTSASSLALFSQPWTAATSSRRSFLRRPDSHRHQLILPPSLSAQTTTTRATTNGSGNNNNNNNNSSMTAKIITSAKAVPTATMLQMSCIPDDNDNDSENKNKLNDDDNNNNFLFPFDFNLHLPKVTHFFRSTLPPPPEDPIALSGDIVALFVYSYVDHTINEMYAQLSTKMDSTSISTESVELVDVASAVITSTLPTTSAAAAAPATAGIQHPLPVWFDTTHLQTFGSNWLAITHIDTPYAPAIASSGLAFVCIATSWLLCGYISGAFLHRNTIECNPSQAMIITFQTWMGTAVLMILLALGSDKLWSALDTINALSPQARGGLTKADADYIFDSLSVLAFWRFMLNWFLGYR